jgi:hypothetical protein
MSVSASAATIYIPRILSINTEFDVANIFDNFEIGCVSRVDFTAIGKKPGFKEEEESNMRAAFVHIEYFYNSKLAVEIQEALEQEKEYRLYISDFNYWMLLKTKTPVKATNMNIHQIVDNCRYLEGIVEKQQKQIEDLTKLLSNIQGEVYQLIGGLYNQTTQAGSIEIHVAHLYNDKIDVENGKVNTSNWSIWPTTRQGDYLEKQVEKIMAKLNISDCDSEIDNNENYYSHDHSHSHSHDDCGCGCDNDSYDSDDIGCVYKRKMEEHANNLLGQKRSYESDSDSDSNSDSNSNSNSDSANESERVKNSSTLCGNE